MYIDRTEVQPPKINRAYGSRALPEALEGNDPYPKQRILIRWKKIKKASQLLERLFCGPTWARTRDHLIMSQVL